MRKLPLWKTIAVGGTVILLVVFVFLGPLASHLTRKYNVDVHITDVKQEDETTVTLYGTFGGISEDNPFSN